MSSKVYVLLKTKKKIGIDETFPFNDVIKLIDVLSPSKIDIEFYSDYSQETLIYLNLDFEGSEASILTKVFQETLIRSETNLDFECFFLKEKNKILFKEHWSCVEVEPDVICLPSDKQIAITLSLLDVACDILKQVHLLNSKTCYKIVLERTEENLDYARLLIPAIADLQVNQYNSFELEKSVNEAYKSTHAGGWSARERICIPESNEGANKVWIENSIRCYLQKTKSFVPDELLSLRWNPSTTKLQNQNLQTIVGQLRNINFLGQLFETIVPPDPTQQMLFTSVDHSWQAIRNPKKKGYAFISYAHSNSAFTLKLLCQLKNENMPYWYDNGIETGSLWDEELESQIRNCEVFIACVSNEYQDSKYCKREIKFADLLNKTILPISSSSWMWGQGLQMMFQELQIATIDDEHDFHSFVKVLQSLAPHVFK